MHKFLSPGFLTPRGQRQPSVASVSERERSALAAESVGVGGQSRDIFVGAILETEGVANKVGRERVAGAAPQGEGMSVVACGSVMVAFGGYDGKYHNDVGLLELEAGGEPSPRDDGPEEPGARSQAGARAEEGAPAPAITSGAAGGCLSYVWLGNHNSLHARFGFLA